MSAPPQGRPPRNDADAGWAVMSTLIAGIVVWGGIGYLLARWLDVEAFLPIGIVLGVGAATYSVYVRYGRS